MDRLVETLNGATSLEPEQRAESMSLLEQWEAEPNYHLSLQRIYMDKSIPQKTRSLAIISLKNGISKYWRKTSKGAISNQEKTAIKNNLLSNLNEPIANLANVQAVVTSRIARFDFPNDWPDLLETLIPIVQKSFKESRPDESALRLNSLYTLHLSMKSLCTKTLPAARRLTQMIAPNVFKYLSTLLFSQFELFCGQVCSGNAISGLEAISHSRISLKCLRRIIVNGYQYYSQNQECVEFMSFLTHAFSKTLSIRPNLSGCNPQVLKIVDNFMKLIGKILLDCAQHRVVDFILVPHSIVLLQQFSQLLVNPENFIAISRDDMLLETIQIQAIKALKSLINHSEYHTLAPHRDQRLESALSVLQSNLFTPEFILSTTRLMISRYTILKDDALREWQDDPESFFQEEESDVWEYNQRRCAEKLLMLLISNNKDLTCPFLIDILKALPNDYSFSNLKFREAVYSSIGFAAYSLGTAFDFEEWLTVLALECNRSELEWNIIKRRVAILITQWIPLKSFNNQTLIYQVLLSILCSSNDLVVRLTAVNAIKTVVDDLNFQSGLFIPYLQQIIDCLMNLLGCVDEFESKLTVINCLIVLIERMDGEVLPSITPLLNILPSLWDRSDGQNLFRSSIVAVITKLVSSLRGDSFHLYPMVIPILRESLDITKPSHLYLLEQGLDLLLATVQNSDKVSSYLVSLVPSIIAFLQLGTENLKKVLHILEAFILLAPLEILNLYADPLFEQISTLLGKLTVNASNALLRLVDITLQACYIANCFPSLIQVMYSKGIFNQILSTILAGTELNVIVVGLLMIIFRTIVYDANSTLQIIQSGGEFAIERFIDIMIDKYDCLSYAKQRKLCALACASLIGTGNNLVVQRFSGLCTILTSVYASNLDNNDMVVFTFETRDGDDDESSLDFQRRSDLRKKDLIFNPNSLGPFLKLKIGECEAALNQKGLVDSIVDLEIRAQINRMIG